MASAPAFSAPPPASCHARRRHPTVTRAAAGLPPHAPPPASRKTRRRRPPLPPAISHLQGPPSHLHRRHKRRASSHGCGRRPAPPAGDEPSPPAFFQRRAPFNATTTASSTLPRQILCVNPLADFASLDFKKGSVQKFEQEKEPASGPAQQHEADKSGRRPLHHELVQFDLAQAGNSLMPSVSVPPYTAAIIVFLQLPLNN